MKNYTIVGKSKEKIDSLALATGSSRFVDDFELKNPLYLAFLYSPHAHAEITNIDDREARQLPGVVDVFHFKNVKPILHTTAGQGFPEPSPTIPFCSTRKCVLSATGWRWWRPITGE